MLTASLKREATGEAERQQILTICVREFGRCGE